jgi:hypothetical protein
MKAPKTEGHRPWTEDEIARYETAHPIGSKARLALALPLYTALRKSDFLKVGPQHIRDGILHVTQQKTGEKLQIANPLRAAGNSRCHAVQSPDVPGEHYRWSLQPQRLLGSVSAVV